MVKSLRWVPAVCVGAIVVAVALLVSGSYLFAGLFATIAIGLSVETVNQIKVSRSRV